MENFTPVSALIGGSMIGLAAVMFMWLNGRVTGISGILGGLFPPASGDISWRIAFIAGMVLAPIGFGAMRGGMPVVELPSSNVTLILGGLLVGFGTRLGSGCTSGHGVCGIARLSPRSVTATLIFMGFGFVTVFVTRHVMGV